MTQPSSDHHFPRQRLRHVVHVVNLRWQMALVIFLLGFLPNLGILLTAPPQREVLAWVWMIIVGLISGAIGYFVSGVLLRPLGRLEAELEEGMLLEARSDDPAEVLLLRQAFAGLLKRLQTEQERRNAFMATLVHDLKTPLIAAGHLTTVLTQMPLPPEEREEIGKQLSAENERLLRLVQQMSDAHRFERDHIKLEKQETPLRPLLEQIAKRLERTAKQRGLCIRVIGEATATAESATLERAIINLAENALRYAKSEVVLRCYDWGISVADDGPGLHCSLEELAQPFNAQPTMIAGKQYTAGTAGLGLYIVQQIARAHGGELRHTRKIINTPEGHTPKNHTLPQEYTVFHIHLLPSKTPYTHESPQDPFTSLLSDTTMRSSI